MLDLSVLGLPTSAIAALPDDPEIVSHLRHSVKATAYDVLRQADRTGTPVLQPRCGVGGHQEMLSLLRALEEGANPGMLTVTIDSHTRLGHFDAAAATLRADPLHLNGYPLVAHGWRRGRQLNESVRVPLEVRHGSPDARELFAVAIASGMTSFEGGGVSYNLPYSKDVPLASSLRAWQQIDQACGQLAEAGVVIDREFFGTLTAVLVPPSLSIAITLLEAMAAAAAGVRCLSLSYPQGGQIHQDVAALRAVRVLASRYLPTGCDVFPVLHQFMGVFPADTATADALIFYGALTGRLGRAAKIITKTNQESSGIPDAAANIRGLATSSLALSGLLNFITLDEDRVEEEQYWIEREVEEILAPVLDGNDLLGDIASAFGSGRLDIPFSASVHARSAIVPRRDADGAIRYFDSAGLPLSRASVAFHKSRLGPAHSASGHDFIGSIKRDIDYFAARESHRCGHPSKENGNGPSDALAARPRQRAGAAGTAHRPSASG